MTINLVLVELTVKPRELVTSTYPLTAAHVASVDQARRTTTSSANSPLYIIVLLAYLVDLQNNRPYASCLIMIKVLTPSTYCPDPVQPALSNNANIDVKQCRCQFASLSDICHFDLHFTINPYSGLHVLLKGLYQFDHIFRYSQLP